MESPNPKRKILVVDDEKLIADTLVQILNLMGYDAVSVYDGIEALEGAATTTFDMLISDVVMPGKDELLFRIGQTVGKRLPAPLGTSHADHPFSDTLSMEFRAQSGALLGLPAAFSHEPYSMTAVAFQDSKIAVMKREEFCRLIASNPSLSLDVLRILAAETRDERLAITTVGMKRIDRVGRAVRNA